MESTGGEFEFGWFVLYLITSIALLAGIVTWGLIWNHRKSRRERHAEKRAKHAEFRAWRDGNKPPKE